MPTHRHRSSRRAASLVALAHLLGACSEEIRGPVPSVASIAPKAVCNEQLLTPVTISGSGMSPLPIDTLQDTPKVALPRVDLTWVQELTGAAGTQAMFTIPDDPEDPAQSHVRWNSQSSLVFDVYPELSLPRGLFDVSVTNANGSGAVLAESLLAVPPPTLGAVAPDLLCGDKGNTMTLTGDFFIRFADRVPRVSFGGTESFAAADMSDCRALPGTSGAEACRQMSIDMPSGALSAGGAAFANFQVTVHNPESVQCASVESVVLTIVPEPTLAAIVPDLLCVAEGDNPVTIDGSGFITVDGATPTLQIGHELFPTQAVAASCTQVTGPAATVQSCTQLTATIPQDALAVELHAVRIINPAPADCETQQAVGLRVVPPPAVSAVVPDLACVAEGARSITVRGSGFLVVDADHGAVLPSVRVGTLELAATMNQASCTILDGVVEAVQSCTELSVLVPDTVLTGLHDVVVTNPAPAGCTTAPVGSLFVVPPPTLTEIAPAAFCLNQGSATLVVRGQSFLTVDGSVPTFYLRDGGADAYALQPALADMSGCETLSATLGVTQGPVETVSVCNELLVHIPTDDATATVQYQARVENPAPAGCGSNELPVTKYPEPTVTNVSPTALCTGGSTLTVTGQNLVPGSRLLLDTIPSTTLNVSDDGTSATAFFSALPIGVYSVTFENAGGCIDGTFATQVSVNPGPQAFFADPPTAYNGIETRITVYATGLTAPIAVRLHPVSGGDAITLTSVDDSNPNKVRASIPVDTLAGQYHVELSGAGGGCNTAFLDAGITIVDETTLDLVSVTPGFGASNDSTAVTIVGDTTGGGFIETPRVYLSPVTPGETATALEAVSFLDATTLTAMIPAGLTPDTTYNLVVVNPDGSVGVSDGPAEQFRVTLLPPPTIDAISPGSVENSASVNVAVTGSNFRDSGASPILVELLCKTDITATTHVTVPTTASYVDSTRVNINFNASAYTNGGFCVVRVTNTDDQTFADFSSLVITNPAQKMLPYADGPNLNSPRRALVASAGRASSAARYLYAIGGDDGTDGGTRTAVSYRTVEAASVDVFGNPGPFAVLQYELGTARAFAGGVTIGRFVYVVGGTSDGAAALGSVERAYILSPEERPLVDSVDLDVIADSGLGAGLWYYRVAAVMDANDPFNPGGESLPSEAFIVRLPDLGTYGVHITLRWSDASDAVAYRVYRSPTANADPGSEQLIAELACGAEVDCTTPDLSYVDEGDAVQSAVPLKIGALGKWHTPLDGGGDPLQLAHARMGAGVTYAINPADSTKAHIYVLGGHDGTAATRNYQLCTLGLESDGRQTVLANFAVGLLDDATTVNQFATARWKLGAYWANPSNAPSVGSTHYIYAAAGTTSAGTLTNSVDAAAIGADGRLAALGPINAQGQNIGSSGYGAVLANNFLYALGGASTGGTPVASGVQAQICPPSGMVAGCTGQGAPSVGNWSSTNENMAVARHLPGAILESAFIYVLGGETTGGVATATTEMTVW